MALSFVSDTNYVGGSAATADDVAVTIDASTSHVVVYAGYDGSVASLAGALRTASGGGGSSVGTFTNPYGSGVFGISGGGGYHGTLIIDITTLSLSPGTYYCRVTHTTSRTGTLRSVRVQGAKVNGSGAAGCLDFDAEGVVINGVPTDLVLTSVSGGKILSFLIQRDVGSRTTTPTDTLSGATALYTDTTSGLGIDKRVCYPADTSGSTATSGYTIQTDGSDDPTGFFHFAYTFEEAGGSSTPTTPYFNRFISQAA